MKQMTAVFLLLIFIFSVTACKNQQQQVDDRVQSTSGMESEEHVDIPSQNQNQNDSGSSRSISASHILIAYFTWAENTQIENPDMIDVDATTSASVLLPGNAAKLAGWIQERVGGDLFSIVVTEPYSSDYDECLKYAADEKADNARPELVNHVDNMDAYDVVFLGFPNWWYTVPMAIHSFLEEYDFSGKTVIPFCTHGTSGLASAIQDIEGDLPDSVTLLEPIGVYRPKVDFSHDEINEWLDGLGFTKIENDALSENSGHEEKSVLLLIDGQAFSVTLYDTPAANSFYDMLPVELTFEDYNGTEKISYLTDTLDTEGELDGFDPSVGDLCLYEPWGNLCIFYNDFGYSDRLILLGHVDEGMDVIGAMTDDFMVTIEKIY